MLITFSLCQRRKILSFVCVFSIVETIIPLLMDSCHYIIGLCMWFPTNMDVWGFVQASWHLIFSDNRHFYHKCQWRMLQGKKVKFSAFVAFLQWLKVKHQVYKVLYGCSNNSSEWLMPRKSPFIASFCVTETLVFYCRLTRPVVRYVASENRYHGFSSFLCTSGQTKERHVFIYIYI